MVVPIVASFAAAGSAIAAAGGIAAAMSTFTGFLAVAGAALTGVGALTGKKDLMKIGGLMTLGSSIATAFNSAGTAAGEVAGEAAADEASRATAQEGFRASEYADPAYAGGAGDAAAASATQPSMAGFDQASQQAATSAADAIDPLERANNLLGGGQGDGASVASRPPLYESARDAIRQAELAGSKAFGGPSASLSPSGVTIDGQVMSTAPDAVADGTRMLTSDQVKNLTQRSLDRTGKFLDNFGDFRRQEILDVNSGGGLSAPVLPSGVTINGQVMPTTAEPSLWDRAMGLAGKAGGFLERNPSMVLVGGKMLAGALGPEAEELDWKKSIYARRLRNQNSPVALTFGRT